MCLSNEQLNIQTACVDSGSVGTLERDEQLKSEQLKSQELKSQELKSQELKRDRRKSGQGVRLQRGSRLRTNQLRRKRKSRLAASRRSAGLIIDLFAGGGGASVGIESAMGRPVDYAINHDPIAIACHEANHPKTVHLTSDIFEVDPDSVIQGRLFDLLWASPDCTHFSRAKGGKPRSKNIRSLAWVVIEWAKRRPRMIILENVSEFQHWGPLLDGGKPCPDRKGETFNKFIGKLENMGYRVEYKVLNAADFGAPTARSRLFLIASRDGGAITWPTPTHGVGPGRTHPHRTAAECIDWSIPCPSVFLTAAEVKEQGLRCRRPLAENTMRRIAEGVRRYVLEDPEPFVLTIDQHGSGGPCVAPSASPIGTVVTKNNKAIVVPTLIQTGFGERAGQAPRVPGLGKPLGAVCAGGSKRGLVAALLTKHFGGVVGHELTRPTGTITATDHHAVTTATLSDEPCDRSDRLHAFMVKYYGTGGGSSINGPVHTITSKDRMGLVTVQGCDYRIVDIGMRMLEPHELLRAQFGRFADSFDLEIARTKRNKIRLIGNSVCPEVADAIVRANSRVVC